MYSHAAGFYSDHNEALKALELLELNLKLRPNSDSYVALSELQLNFKLKKEVKENIKKAISMPPVSKKLCDIANKLIGMTADLNLKCLKF